MVLSKLINQLINQYGVTFELELEDLKTIKFKGIINNSNNSFFNNMSYLKNDFLQADPGENNFVNLIVSDPSVLKEIRTGLIVNQTNNQINNKSIASAKLEDKELETREAKYQVLKHKKYFLADKLYYITVFLTAI